MAETAGEKNLAPTEKRLKEAAKNGDVLRSKDLAAALSTLIGAAFLHYAGPWILDDLGQVLRASLSWDRRAIDNFDPGRMLFALGAVMLPPILVMGAGTIGLTMVIQLVLAGPGRFNAENLVPKTSRLNPMSGMTRVFGAQGWIEMAKGLLKVSLLGSIVYLWARGRLAMLMSLSAVDLSGQLAFGWQAVTSLFFWLAAGLVIIAMVDFPIQWIRRRRRLRMSLQEVRDEHKEQDGSPQAKNARRQRQRQLAMSGIARSMRQAQFVVTNPTHFAVAMTYDPDLAPAPVVMAKGRGEKALAMRELAAEYGLPVLEFPALARSVYYTTRERQMIREELYAAVAGVLGFVLSLKRGEVRAAPEIEVPVELRFDPDGRLQPDATT